LQGRSREDTKKRALEIGNKKHKNHRVEIWAGGALLYEYGYGENLFIHTYIYGTYIYGVYIFIRFGPTLLMSLHNTGLHNTVCDTLLPEKFDF